MDSYEYDDGFGNEWELAEMLVEEAFDLYEKGQMRQAFQKLKKAVQKGPENGAWYFNMALTLDGMEHYEQAIECYEKALELQPDDTEIMNCLGVDYTRTAQYDLALATFERIAALDPLFEPSYCNRIITYTEMELHEKAEEMFYLAQQIHSDCPLCFYNIGNSLFSRGRYDRAIWCWEKTATLDTGHPQINFRLAQAYWVNGNGDKARRAFLDEIRKNPADLDVLMDFGIYLLEDGDMDAAKEKFNRILEFAPEFAMAHFYLGEVLRLRGDIAAAARQYRAAITGDEHLPGPRFRLAEILCAQQQTEAALKLMCDEVKQPVQDSDVLVGMGQLFLQLKDADNATNCFLGALDVEQQDPRAYTGLGMAMVMRGELQAGRQCLEQSLRLDDEDVETLLNAAWLCCQMEDWQAAREFVDRGRALSGQHEPFFAMYKSLEKQIKRRPIETWIKRLPETILSCFQ